MEGGHPVAGAAARSAVPHRSASPALCPCGHAAAFRRRASSFVRGVWSSAALLPAAVLCERAWCVRRTVRRACACCCPSARSKLAASGHSGCFGRSEMGGSAFCSREWTAEWPQPARQRPLGDPAIGRFVGSKIPHFCAFCGFCLGFCVFCVKLCPVVRDWKGGLLVLYKNGAKNGNLGALVSASFGRWFLIGRFGGRTRLSKGRSLDFFGRTRLSRGRCHWPLAQKFVSRTVLSCGCGCCCGGVCVATLAMLGVRTMESARAAAASLGAREGGGSPVLAASGVWRCCASSARAPPLSLCSRCRRHRVCE